MRRESSLRLRLLLAMALVFLLGVGGGMLYYYVEAYWVGDRLEERTLQTQAQELTAALRDPAEGAPLFALPDHLAPLYAGEESTSFYTLYDPERRPLARSPNLERPLPFLAAPEDGGFGDLRFLDLGREPVAALPVRISAQRTLVVGRSRPDKDALAFTIIQEGLEGLAIVILPFALFSLLIIWRITERSLRPVARASEQARAIGPRNPGARIDTEDLPSEVRPLAEAANEAVERLAQAYEMEKRLTADAAHELRTPLTVLGLRLQQAKRKGVMDWPKIEREIAAMNALVDQLLDLARKESAAEAADPADAPLVSLPRLMREAAAAVLPLIEAAGRVLEVEAPEQAQLRGRPEDLRDLMRNLLENALKHGAGRIRIRLSRVESPEPGFLLQVEDEGRAPLTDALFQRFRKGDSSSAGSGLGLSIVRQVARNHGGEAAFAAGSPTTRVEAFLPILRRG